MSAARKFLFGKLRIGARYLDLRGHLLSLLILDTAIDRGERLAGADPLARLDQNASHHAAFTGNADRHVDSGSQGAGGRNGTGNLLATGNDNRYARRRTAGAPRATCTDPRCARASRCRLAVLTIKEVSRDQRHHGEHGADDQRAAGPPAPRLVERLDNDLTLEGLAPPTSGFEVHGRHLSRAPPRDPVARQAVLSE